MKTYPRHVFTAIFAVFGLYLSVSGIASASILVPMDKTQTDHLKAYGLTYFVLLEGDTCQWLLNYKGGSFLLPEKGKYIQKARAMGVRVKLGVNEDAVLKELDAGNMKNVMLEKAPTIAVYTPKGNDPWDDAVTLALEYADIPYTKLWDREVMRGELAQYDWLHLHHEDFTGQYGKFYSSFHNAIWYKLKVKQFEELARELGYKSVHEEKKAVARAIRQYVENGGFMFAMCSATDTLDVALAAETVDIVPEVMDGSPVEPGYASKLDYSKTLAFKDFSIITDPMVYEHSNIDVSSMRRGSSSSGYEDFELFQFSAKFDPVPTMLNQNHVKIVPGFYGQTTSFAQELIKPEIRKLATVPGTGRVKYIHGNRGKGTFTLLGGHDPEDAQHIVGDPPTDLNLHKNSPGYRLILNNILFPAAEKIERKT